MPRPELEIVILMGIQASGKSTFYVSDFSRTHMRISLDMLNTRPREKRLLEACLNVGQSVVIDNTNPLKKDRERYILIAKDKKVKVRGYYFQPDLQKSIERNAKRDSTTKVPTGVIISRFNNIEPPSFDEGFSEIFLVKSERGKFIMEEYLEDEHQIIESKKAESRCVCVDLSRCRGSHSRAIDSLRLLAHGMKLGVSSISEKKGSHIFFEVFGDSKDHLDLFTLQALSIVNDLNNKSINIAIKISYPGVSSDSTESSIRNLAMDFKSLENLHFDKVESGFWLSKRTNMFINLKGLKSDIVGFSSALERSFGAFSVTSSLNM